MAAREQFFIGGEQVDTPAGPALRGQVFVDHLVPTEPSGESFVLVHGGGGQGVDWLTTPDGRPGWAPLLAQRGHDVYVVDRVAHGRSPYDPHLLGELAPAMPFGVIASVFFPPASGEGSHPASDLHTQWPGDGTFDDPAVRQFVASQGPVLADADAAQRLDQAALVALAERTGPVHVVGHSAGAPAAFLLADARPELVRSLTLCEPLGPPIVGLPGMPPPLWGPTRAALTYDPPASSPEELAVVVDHSGPVPLALQLQPARRLPNLARVPIRLVTAEASVFRWFENHLAAYLQQAGCEVEQIRLWERGIRGNAHGFPFELNHEEILELLLARVLG